MGKKGKGNSAEKAMAKAAKKAKQEKSAQKKALKDQRKAEERAGAHQPKSKQGKKDKQGKQKKKGKDDEEDLDALLEQFKKDWEKDHQVQEERQSGPPSRRANATLTACPLGTDLWLFGGEYFDGESANFYADLFRYTPHSGPVSKMERLGLDSDSDSDDEEAPQTEIKDLGVWRTYSSKNQPGPRSAHQMVATPQQGGLLWLFGGEFASQRMTSFHHYRDLWVFSIASKTWERIETRVKPSARSGHRMAAWKNFLVLFGGFVDTGARTTYLNDLWLFDMEQYKWVELPQNDFRRPGPRSGFSFLPTTEGVVLHGGYCKRYIKGQRTQGVQLEDTWMLKLVESAPTLQNPLGVKAEWVRRRKIGYAPNPPRSGCTMALWPTRQMGVLFGGVTDTERDEESLESSFYNALYGYQLPGAGRWISLNLRRPKKMGGQGGKKKRAKAAAAAAAAKAKAEEIARRQQEQEEERKAWEQDDVSDEEGDKDKDSAPPATPAGPSSAKADLMAQAATAAATVPENDDPNDPLKTVPLERYNTMLAVQRNTLYLYGGIYEQGDREYTLDDFYTLDLVKMTRYQCLRACPIDKLEWHDSDSDSDEDEDEDEDGDGDDEDDDESDSEDGEGEEAPEGVEFTEEQEEHDSDYDDDELDPEERARIAKEKEELRARATKFLGVSKDTARTEEDILRTPQVGETVAAFYERSKVYWSQQAHSQAEAEQANNPGAEGLRGKELRRKAFDLANRAYDEYRPLLREIERIHRDAGLDPADVKHGPGPAATQPSVGLASRNRR